MGGGRGLWGCGSIQCLCQRLLWASTLTLIRGNYLFHIKYGGGRGLWGCGSIQCLCQGLLRASTLTLIRGNYFISYKIAKIHVQTPKKSVKY